MNNENEYLMRLEEMNKIAFRLSTEVGSKNFFELRKALEEAMKEIEVNSDFISLCEDRENNYFKIFFLVVKINIEMLWAPSMKAVDSLNPNKGMILSGNGHFIQLNIENNSHSLKDAYNDDGVVDFFPINFDMRKINKEEYSKLVSKEYSEKIVKDLELKFKRISLMSVRL